MRAAVLATIVVVAGACAVGPGATGGPPQPSAVAPDRGYAQQSTPVVISGQGFAGIARQPSGGGTPVLDTTHRAWLDDTELAGVTWVDTQTLRATVPESIPVGPHALTVEGPSGERGTLPAAFTVLAAPALVLTSAADPAAVRVGQTFTVTVTVRDAGASDLTALFVSAPTLTSTSGARAALASGPTPAPPTSLGAGQELAVQWTYQAVTAGIVQVTTSATATDAVSGTALAASAPDLLVGFQEVSAALAVAVRSPPTPSSARTGQAFDVAVAFTNAGPADLVRFSVAAPAVSGVDPSRVTIAAPTPAPPATLPTGQTTVITWRVTSAVAGNLGLGFTASGVDGVTGAAAAGSAVATVALTAPPSLSATLTTSPAPPATLDLSQPASVTLALTNAGGASALVTAVAPSSTPAAGAACQAASPPASAAAPVTIAAGATARFTWTCSASTAGTYTLGATVTASDPATGGGLSVSVTGVALGFTTQRRVTVTVAGDGSGTVTSSPTGIGPCGAGGTTCSATFASGSAVTLTATPSGGATVSWSGCDTATGNTCRITQLTADRAITVTFTAPRPVLTVSVGGGKSGTVTSSPSGIAACTKSGGPTCTAPFASGTTIVLTASPSGNARTAWGSGCTSHTTNTCTVQSLTTSRTVSVNFN